VFDNFISLSVRKNQYWTRSAFSLQTLNSWLGYSLDDPRFDADSDIDLSVVRKLRTDSVFHLTFYLMGSSSRGLRLTFKHRGYEWMELHIHCHNVASWRV